MGALKFYILINGIRHERYIPKTPQHNGVAEMMKKTIVNRVGMMSSYAKLVKSFWGEDMMIVVD